MWIGCFLFGLGLVRVVANGVGGLISRFLRSLDFLGEGVRAFYFFLLERV